MFLFARIYKCFPLAINDMQITVIDMHIILFPKGFQINIETSRHRERCQINAITSVLKLRKLYIEESCNMYVNLCSRGLEISLWVKTSVE